LYDKLNQDLRSLQKKKNGIITDEKSRMKDHDLKIRKHYDLEKIQPLCFMTYDFRDFKSSYFNVFAQDLLNNQIEVELTRKPRINCRNWRLCLKSKP